MTPEEALAHLREWYKRDKTGDIDSGACVVAFEALEKRIPKKPIGQHTNYKCPVCGRRVRSGKGSSSFTRDSVCQRCYQVLDWSE